MNIIYKVVRIQDNKYYSAFASRKNIPILEYPLRKWVATPKSFKKYNYLIMAFQQLADAHFFINNNFFIAQDTLVIFDAIYQGKIRTKRVRLLDSRRVVASHLSNVYAYHQVTMPMGTIMVEQIKLLRKSTL